MSSQNNNLIEIADLKVHYPLRGSFVGAADGPRGRLGQGRRRGQLRAEAGRGARARRRVGRGKTTLGRTLLRLVEPTEGSIRFNGDDITGIGDDEMRKLRRKMQIVFQDPHASLNPAMDLETAVGHPLKIHGIARNKEQIRRRVADMLERVGLAPADRFLSKYPGDLSGGQSSGPSWRGRSCSTPTCSSPTSPSRCST